MTAVAIDFGTSNTVVCIEDPVSRTPQTLKFEAISRRFTVAGRDAYVIPSLVFVKAAEQFQVGEVVRSQRLGFAQPDRYFHGFKRNLVADFRPPARQLDGQTYTPERVSEEFLRILWHHILQQVNPTRVVFTVPVGAFERYLSWFREVAQQLGLPNVQLVDESTAAALGYALKQPGALVLVVDFGGGTLDLSLVRTVAVDANQAILKAEVVAKSDAYVGGVDIDTWIVEHYLQQAGLKRIEVSAIAWQGLSETAERLKIRLSDAAEARESWFDDENFLSHDLHLSQGDLTEILETRQLLEQLRRSVDEVLAIAYGKGVSKADIDQVLLVGGSCQIPAVQQLILSYFGRQRVQLDKPFEAVAHGALALGQIQSVQDELRHSYAIRLWEPHARTYSFFPLFTSGTSYPCQRPEPLVLQVATEGQTEIRLDIGEVADLAQAEVSYDSQGRMTSAQLVQQSTFHSLAVAQGESLTEQQVCVAHLNPPGNPGIDRIEVRFEVNPQRMLLATVKDLLTGNLLVEHAAIAKLR